MSETKFTPGPWRYDYEDGYCGEIIASTGKTVATFTDEPNTPNAHLIAAAPELYETLEEVIRISDRKHDAWDKAKAALAKARGEK